MQSISLLRRLNELCDEFESAWREGGVPLLEAHLAGLNGISPGERRLALSQLLPIELEYRRKRGEAPGRDQYLTRFPEDADTVADVFDLPSIVGVLSGAAGAVGGCPHPGSLPGGEGENGAGGEGETRTGGESSDTCPPAPAVIHDGAAGASFDVVNAEAEALGGCPHPDPLPGGEGENCAGGAGEMLPGAEAETRTEEDGEGTCGDGQPAATHAEPRESLPRIDNYELIEEIARGGMGIVYKARQLNPDRVVAVKMISSGRLATEEEIKRFRREAEVASGLNHSRIVPIFEIGKDSSGRPFYSMRFIEGTDLHNRLLAGPLNPQDAARLIVQIAEVIEYAHQERVIHRDLKPGNILLDAQGTPHVADFGLARLLNDERGQTLTGQVLGVPSFMPPEQARGKRDAIRPAVDVYALGAILYNTLTGRPPFQAATTFETIQQVIHDEPASPRLVNRRVPRDLETICLKCLEKEPSRRFASAQELADELRRYLDGKPIRSRPTGPLQKLWRWCRRRPAAAALALVSMAAIVVIVGGLSIYNRDLSALNARLVAMNEELAETLYAANMTSAGKSLDTGDVASASALLERHVPKSGEPDRRGFEFNYMRRMLAEDHRDLLQLDTPIYFVCASPDGQLVATMGRDAIVRFFRPDGRRVLPDIETGQIEVNGAAFSPDGALLATAGDDGMICVWNVAARSLVRSFHGHPEHAFQVAFTPDGSVLACCGNDETVRLFDPRIGIQLGELRGHGRTIDALAMMNDGRSLVTISGDHTAKLWDLGEPEPKTTFQLVGGGALAVSHDAMWLATGSEDGANGAVQVWNLVDGSELSNVAKLDKVLALVLSPKGDELAIADGVGTIHIHGLDTAGRVAAAPRDQWQAHEGRIHHLLWLADDASTGGRLWSVGEDGRLVQWFVHRRERRHVAFDRGESKMSMGDLAVLSGRSALIAVPSGVLEVGLRAEFGGPRMHDTGTCDRVMASADGRVLVGLRRRGCEVCIWDMSEDRGLRRVPLTGDAYEAALSRDGRVLAVSRARPTGGEYDEVLLIDVPSAAIIEKIAVSGLSNVALAADGKRLIAVKDIELAAFDIESGARTAHQDRKIWSASQRLLHVIRVSADSRYVATGGGDREVLIRSMDTGEVVHRLSGHLTTVGAIAFSSDGRTLASGSSDGQIKLWHVPTGQLLMDFDRVDGGCHKLAFTDDRRYLVCLTGWGQVIYYDAPPGEVADDR